MDLVILVILVVTLVVFVVETIRIPIHTTSVSYWISAIAPFAIGINLCFDTESVSILQLLALGAHLLTQTAPVSDLARVVTSLFLLIVNIDHKINVVFASNCVLHHLFYKLYIDYMTILGRGASSFDGSTGDSLPT
jgi:hypothetical protein